MAVDFDHVFAGVAVRRAKADEQDFVNDLTGGGIGEVSVNHLLRFEIGDLGSIDLALQWQSVAPELVNLESAQLASASASAQLIPRMRSLLVVREGRLAHEEYFGGWTADTLADVRSVTKSPEESALNTTLLAMSRDSTGVREIVRGESPLTQGAGRTSVGSGAMGRRVGVSTGGAGDGEQPRGNPDGNAQAEPVLGRKTVRLRMQLQTVKIDSTEPEVRDGAEESFYAATQAQAAKTDYETVTAVQTGGAEQITGKERLPLAYRDAVKRYTLRQHRRDEQLAAQERAAR